MTAERGHPPTLFAAPQPLVREEDVPEMNARADNAAANPVRANQHRPAPRRAQCPWMPARVQGSRL